MVQYIPFDLHRAVRNAQLHNLRRLIIIKLYKILWLKNKYISDAGESQDIIYSSIELKNIAKAGEYSNDWNAINSSEMFLSASRLNKEKRYIYYFHAFLWSS